MIKVSRLNREEFFINSDLIEFIEETPDTVISLQSGRKVVVSERADEIVRRIMQYKRALQDKFQR